MSIRERPSEVEDRAIPGHWEADLLAGRKNSHIATLVERQSRFVVIVQIPGKDTTSVVNALVSACGRPARFLDPRSETTTLAYQRVDGNVFRKTVLLMLIVSGLAMQQCCTNAGELAVATAGRDCSSRC